MTTDATLRLLRGGLGDHSLLAFLWTGTGDDVCLKLSPPPGTTTTAVFLLFAFVTGLKLDLDFGEYMGTPLLFGCEVEELPHERLAVRLNFGAAPEGQISFECNGILELDGWPTEK